MRREWMVLGSAVAVILCRQGSVRAEEIEAGSCEADDVQAAVDMASDGDTVLVPAQTCTWSTPAPNTAAVVIQGKSVTLQGAGMGQTVIIDETGSQWEEHSVHLACTQGVQPRITGITFDDDDPTTDVNRIIKVEDCQGFRIDHCEFTNLLGQGAIVVFGASEGVIDHCVIRAPGDYTVQSISVHGEDEASWKRPLELGTAGAVYIEDCFFDFGYINDGALDSNNGSRWVFRYNLVHNTGASNHSACSSGGRGSFSSEVYENTFISNHTSSYTAIWLRSGTGVIFNNVIEGVQNYNVAIAVDNYRTTFTDNCLDPLDSRCDGSSPLDGNTPGSMGYPCLDQIGRATDHSESGSIYEDPTGIHPQTHEPLYEWGNIADGQDADITVLEQNAVDPAMSDHIREGRDFFSDTPRPRYLPYVYPHPLTLQDPPGNRALDLSGSVSEGRVALSWSLVDGAQEYLVFRDWVQVASTASIEHTEDALDGEHVYSVKALDGSSAVLASESVLLSLQQQEESGSGCSGCAAGEGPASTLLLLLLLLAVFFRRPNRGRK